MCKGPDGKKVVDMKYNWLILFALMVISLVVASGCAGNSDNSSSPEGSEEETPAGNDSSEVTEIVDDGDHHGVRMEYYGVMKPSEIELEIGDTIAWRNYKPQGTYVLVSEDNLFGKQEISSKDVYVYTFKEKGTYTFGVEDVPEMTLKVTVK
ncbi:cupredoxin domain-containing protein [Methanohalophilus mahii]|uniref:Cell surface lipoprotein n=1 Tax=Methanohalophilus mahii (strain ATCC 35705 / DSM 5219 / SLP) TaxID=547558 RepID=D5EAR6_METMS|nr:hypothetical protein [Methanohalophilus mahii]ADE36267.1 hypothetical protein Mmah_0743 [Methanohalophilus mahii DSM 5219]